MLTAMTLGDEPMLRGALDELRADERDGAVVGLIFALFDYGVTVSEGAGSRRRATDPNDCIAQRGPYDEAWS